MLSALAVVFAGLGLADTWTGRLLDASCFDQQKSARSCDAAAATSTFALDVSGKIYRLDDSGNMKAAEAMKNHAERQADPNAPDNKHVDAKITGTREGDLIKTDTVEIP